MRHTTLTHRFVEYIPDELDEATLYISIGFATAAHKCCCGCGAEVNTPISPTDWKLTFDGVTVSLSPSIGNWSFPCQSHYWIERDRVRWAPRWTRDEIASGRTFDAQVKEQQFGNVLAGSTSVDDMNNDEADESSLWSRLRTWLSRR